MTDVDMPQPLKKWDPTISWAPGDLAKRPELSVYIAKIATLWTRVELDQALLLIGLLGSHAPAGMQMYLAFTGAAAQEAALTAAASSLSKESKLEFASLMLETRKRGKERNRVVHAMWGIGDQFPDALIHCSIENQATDIIQEIEIAAIISKTPFRVIPGDKSKQFINQCSVYKKTDFKSIYNRIAALQRALTAFRIRVAQEQGEIAERVRQLAQPRSEGETSRRAPRTTPSKSH